MLQGLLRRDPLAHVTLQQVANEVLSAGGDTAKGILGKGNLGLWSRYEEIWEVGLTGIGGGVGWGEVRQWNASHIHAALRIFFQPEQTRTLATALNISSSVSPSKGGRPESSI